MFVQSFYPYLALDPSRTNIFPTLFFHVITFSGKNYTLLRKLFIVILKIQYIDHDEYPIRGAKKNTPTVRSVSGFLYFPGQKSGFVFGRWRFIHRNRHENRYEIVMFTRRCVGTPVHAKLDYLPTVLYRHYRSYRPRIIRVRLRDSVWYHCFYQQRRHCYSTPNYVVILMSLFTSAKARA